MIRKGTTEAHPTWAAAAGNALLEFLLALPIIIFIAVLGVHVSVGLLTKQRTVIDARYRLFHAAGRGGWSPLKLEGYLVRASEEEEEEEDDVDPGTRPRGSGEELERLREDIEPETLEKTSNQLAQEYWYRLWENLPGRHETRSERWFEVQGKIYGFIERRTLGDCYRDSSPWHFSHIDAWEIARSGPLRVIVESFRDNLEAEVAPHFEPTRKDIMNRWFHASEGAGEDQAED